MAMPTACSTAVPSTMPARAAPSASSCPCAAPWNSANIPTSTAPAASGSFTCAASNRPTTSIEAAIIGSMAGKATPACAISAPASSRAANDAGAIHSRFVVMALHTPTASMAARWSSPVMGCRKPVRKPPWSCASPTWAAAENDRAARVRAGKARLRKKAKVIGVS